MNLIRKIWLIVCCFSLFLNAHQAHAQSLTNITSYDTTDSCISMCVADLNTRLENLHQLERQAWIEYKSGTIKAETQFDAHIKTCKDRYLPEKEFRYEICASKIRITLSQAKMKCIKELHTALQYIDLSKEHWESQFHQCLIDCRSTDSKSH